MNKLFAGENDLIGAPRYRKFLSEARKFFQRCVTYLRKSMPVLKNDEIKSLTFIRVPDCRKVILEELSILVTRFPNVIPQERTSLSLKLNFLSTNVHLRKSYHLTWMKTKYQTGLILFGIKSQRSVILVLLKQSSNICLIGEISVVNTTFKCVLWKYF